MAAPAVGLIFTPELMPLLREVGELISVVEVEPQSFWRRGESPESVKLDLESFDSFLKLGKRRTVHSSAAPVGGSVGTSPAQMRALRESVRLMRPEWMSEHLSFSRFPSVTGSTFSGFLLPPPQTPAGVAVASHNLLALQREMSIPLAFETGVNYLKPVSGEMRDGDFFAEIARASGCGIVLDLHSLWVNQSNGRQNMNEVIASLPADRVWEIHVAGGSMLNGYLVDAHDNLAPPEVMSALENNIGKFPNLQAVVFEIVPGCVERIGIAAIREQLEALGRICRTCHTAGSRPAVLSRELVRPKSSELAEIAEWETRLAVALHEGYPAPTPGEDPGIAIYRRLINETRAAAIALCLKHSLSMLFLTVGPRGTERMVLEYIHGSEARPFSEDEALAFVDYLTERLSHLPDIADVLSFERNVLETARWNADPSIEIPFGLEATELPAGKARTG
jgi:uncharacterized protein (UPF0276 family)